MTPADYRRTPTLKARQHRLTMPSTSHKPAAAATTPAKQAETAPMRPVLFTLQAVQETWLKKSTDPAADLPEDQKVMVPIGHQLPVVAVRELQGTAHEVVELGHGAGQWHVFSPHYRRLQAKAPDAAPALGGLLQPGQIDWRNFDALVTPNLTVGEVLQFDPRRSPRGNASVQARIAKTAIQYQAMRDAWGLPIGVTSFYRPAAINEAVGGVPNSKHVLGYAVDVYPINRTLESFYQWIRVRWTGGLGDGRHRGFIHLDLDKGSGRFVPGSGARPQREWTY
jgi:putative chitinase